MYVRRHCPPQSGSVALSRKAAHRASKTAKTRKKETASAAKSGGARKLTSTPKKVAKAASRNRKASTTTTASKAASKAKRLAKRTVKPAAKAKTASVRGTRRQPIRASGTQPARKATVSVATEGATKRQRPLTAPEIQHFRQMLLEKRAEILGDVSTLHNEALNKDRRDAAGDLSSMPIHMAELGTDNYELEFTLGLIEGERAILKEIDEALERVQHNTFGICLATGKPIGKARLRAKPWAKYCYEYTLAQEQGQQRRF